MKGWADKITQIKEDEKSLKIAIVVANNHYGGFGPGTVNMFRDGGYESYNLWKY